MSIKKDTVILILLIGLLIAAVIGYKYELEATKDYKPYDYYELNGISREENKEEIKNENNNENIEKPIENKDKSENKSVKNDSNVKKENKTENVENKTQSGVNTDNKNNNSNKNNDKNVNKEEKNTDNTSTNSNINITNTQVSDNNKNSNVNNQANNNVINNQNTNNNVINNQNTNTTTNTTPEPTQTETVDLSKIVSDKTVIPDKYNTGTRGSLTKYTPDMDLGVFFKMSSNTPVINFTFEQNHKPEMIIQNIDFTDYDKVAIYGGGENITDTKIKLIFKNCKFNSVTTASNLDTDITIEFQNCSIKNFGGSNASFNKCFFGGSSHDGMNPHRNVTVKNSYFAGTNTYDANNARHYDGVQMFGSNTIDNLLVENIYFNNVRFEVPAINEVRNGVPSKSGVNAPIMFALEYDNGNNVTFESIIANGGGYSVYATTKNGISYKNVTFKNVKLGYAHLFGILYPMTDANKANTKFINFGYYDSLYVSSVWKDNKGVHIITTNDTLIERKLTCETDKGNFEFNMPAHPKLTRENNSTFKFSQMPYDIDNTITNTDIKYVKCYDTTNTDILDNNNLIRTQKF